MREKERKKEGERVRGEGREADHTYVHVYMPGRVSHRDKDLHYLFPHFPSREKWRKFMHAKHFVIWHSWKIFSSHFCTTEQKVHELILSTKSLKNERTTTFPIRKQVALAPQKRMLQLILILFQPTIHMCSPRATYKNGRRISRVYGS